MNLLDELKSTWNSIPPLAWPPAPVHLAMAGIVFLLLLILLLLVRPKRLPGVSQKPAARRHPIPVANQDAGPTSPDALQGGLKHMPLPDLLQFLAQGQRTGTLEIKSGRREGLIRLVQGMVVHSEFRRSLDLDALFEMLSLETGDFVFTPSTPPDYGVNGREVVDILMLWLSRKDSTR